MIVGVGAVELYKGRGSARFRHPGLTTSGRFVSLQFQARLSDLCRTASNTHRGQDQMVRRVLGVSTVSSIRIDVDLLDCVW